ncbi:MAG: DUF4302 domain-containing protein [Tannerellaceae bacterium]|jgi:hypothetical protein|nr:DUF4302 domain-containing protein [Tannerellaceae bacterium]
MKIDSRHCLLVVLLFSLSSCLLTEDDLFPESAALRLNHAIDQAKATLLAAETGWVMDYFPTPESGGYTLLVKFDRSGLATVAARNTYFPTFTSSSGTFDVIGDNGPVLTFNSYNDLFHSFSNPENPTGIGLGGDYEFIILEVTDDLIKLKGKKRATDIRLRKLTAEEGWEAFANTVHDMDAFLFDPKAPSLFVHIGDKKYIATEGANHVFSMLPEGADKNLSEPERLPFIVTPNGLRLYKPYESGEGSEKIEVQHFVLNPDKTALVASENSTVRITGQPATAFFLDSLNWTGTNAWVIDKEHLGGLFSTAYQQVVENCKTKYKEDFDSFFLTYKGARRGKTFSFKSGRYEGAYDFEIALVNDRPVFTYKGTADRNGEIYLANIGGIGDFIAALGGDTYTVTADSPICPTVLTLTGVSNPNNWFKLILK